MALLQQTCKICKDGKPWGRLDVHIRNVHKITPEQYEMYDSNLGEIVEFKHTDPITHTDLIDNIFDGKTKKNSLDEPLKEFLKEFDLTEKDLRAIIHNYKEGKPLPLEQSQKLKETKGIEEANRVKDHNVVKTQHIHTAEALEKYHGFKCVAVYSAKGTIPKMWELEKQK